jgi:hypothetical protein
VKTASECPLIEECDMSSCVASRKDAKKKPSAYSTLSAMFNQYADAQCRSVLKWIHTLGCEKKTRCFVLFEERMEYVAWSLFPRKATGSRFDFVAAFFSV